MRPAEALDAVRSARIRIQAADAELEDLEELLAAELAAGEGPDPATQPAITPMYLSGNHTKGRGSYGRPLAVVMHISGGSLESMTNTFRNPTSRVSAHYGVGKKGQILQYVRDEDQSWGAGLVLRPTAPMVIERPGINPNLWVLNVEHEGFANDIAPFEQIEASARLLANRCDHHSILLDRRHVILHCEIRADKTCPGKLPVDEIVARARQLRA